MMVPNVMTLVQSVTCYNDDHFADETERYFNGSP
jgi:hypothetical protein